MFIISFSILFLIALLIGSLPRWSYSRYFGYGPCTMTAAVLTFVIVKAINGTLY